jgi:hypothetical protein
MEMRIFASLFDCLKKKNETAEVRAVQCVLVAVVALVASLAIRKDCAGETSIGR